ncbi:CPK27, partial [Symbiodinium necroappetens]
DGIVSKGEFQEGFHVLCTREAKNVSQEVLSAIAKNVENFTSASSMKKAALTAAARHLEGYELQKLLDKFESEWKLGFAMADGSKTATWAEEAFLALDTDGSGEIDYSEFLAAVMDAKHLERRDLLWATFQECWRHIEVKTKVFSYYVFLVSPLAIVPYTTPQRPILVIKSPMWQGLFKGPSRLKVWGSAVRLKDSV